MLLKFKTRKKKDTATDITSSYCVLWLQCLFVESSVVSSLVVCRRKTVTRKRTFDDRQTQRKAVWKECDFLSWRCDRDPWWTLLTVSKNLQNRQDFTNNSGLKLSQQWSFSLKNITNVCLDSISSTFSPLYLPVAMFGGIITCDSA